MSRFFHLIGLAGLFAVTGPGLPTVHAADNPQIQAALDRVVAHCPRAYPGGVTQLPEGDEFTGKSTDELLKMLSHWNPAVRAAAGEALTQRSEEALPALREALKSESWQIRAGAAGAMAQILAHQMRNWQTVCPDSTNYREAQETIRKRYAPLAAVCLPLFEDPHREVRAGALGVVAALQLRDKPYQAAVLELCTDDDEYLAQNAALALQKHIGIDQLDPDAVVPLLTRALHEPLPRGKGCIVSLIATQDRAHQRKYVPALLSHIDWYPDRDTMFGAGGQELAVKLLTQMKVEDLVPRIPALLTKDMRGTSMLYPAAAAAIAFGPEARPVLPQMRAEAAKMKVRLEEIASWKDSSRAFRRGQYAELAKRYDALTKAIADVEK